MKIGGNGDPAPVKRPSAVTRLLTTRPRSRVRRDRQGTGALSLMPNGAVALETGMSTAMTAVHTRGDLLGSRTTGGFTLGVQGGRAVGRGVDRAGGRRAGPV